MLNELFPDAKTVGFPVLPAEPNSHRVDTVKAALEDLGYTCEYYYAFSDSNDISSVVTNAA